MRRLVFLLALACTAAVTSRADAALISADDAVYGAGVLTKDTTSSLEWLDLTESAGFSVSDVAAGAGGFLANGFAIATVAQVETLFSDGGWDGVDDSPSTGSVGHLAFVQLMQSLLGVTGDSPTIGETVFSEGYALSAVADLAARPFVTISQFGAAGRIACTTAGFNAYPVVNDFNVGCRIDFNQHYGFIGTYLVRPSSVPEPASILSLGAGLAALVYRRTRRLRSDA